VNLKYINKFFFVDSSMLAGNVVCLSTFLQDQLQQSGGVGLAQRGHGPFRGLRFWPPICPPLSPLGHVKRATAGLPFVSVTFEN